jgi:hypothetical protein
MSTFRSDIEFQCRRLEFGTAKQQRDFIAYCRDKPIYIFDTVASDLIAAAAFGFVNAIAELLPERLPAAKALGENALWWAIKTDKPYAVRALVESGMFPVDMHFHKKYHDDTPLLLATELERVEIMEVLFRCGASTKNLWDWHDNPPFKVALERRNIKMIKLLVDVCPSEVMRKIMLNEYPRAVTRRKQIFEAVRGYPLDDVQQTILFALPTWKQRLEHIMANEEEDDETETDDDIR